MGNFLRNSLSWLQFSEYSNFLSAQHEEVIKLTQELIDVINRGNYANYTRICDHDMSAFEPESLGNIVIGMPFHKFYFDNGEMALTCWESSESWEVSVNENIFKIHFQCSTTSRLITRWSTQSSLCWAIMRHALLMWGLHNILISTNDLRCFDCDD